MKASGRTLLESAVDYAGTFPPARLDLAEALRLYAGYRAGPHAWMLGRYLLPASKMAEFDDLAPGVLEGPEWQLSLVLSPDPGPDIDRLEPFARRWRGKARIVSLEAPPLEASPIGEVAALIPRGLEAFFEVPLGADLEPRLRAIRAAGAGAKVRTGGLTREAFPSPEELCRFLLACARAGIPFKATAGLHHPVRSARSLGEGPGSPLVTMHGFLNLAVSAALAHAGKVGPEEALEVLEESSPGAFRFLADGLLWKERMLDLSQIAQARRSFFRSFGACSFEEPVGELEESHL